MLRQQGTCLEFRVWIFGLSHFRNLRIFGFAWHRCVGLLDFPQSPGLRFGTVFVLAGGPSLFVFSCGSAPRFSKICLLWASRGRCVFVPFVALPFFRCSFGSHPGVPFDDLIFGVRPPHPTPKGQTPNLEKRSDFPTLRRISSINPRRFRHSRGSLFLGGRVGILRRGQKILRGWTACF